MRTARALTVCWGVYLVPGGVLSLGVYIVGRVYLVPGGVYLVPGGCT